MEMRKAELEWSLLALRLTIFLVMLVWTLDKFMNPGHAAKVYENFYFIGGMESMAMFVIGLVEFVILLGFVAGLYKKTDLWPGATAPCYLHPFLLQAVPGAL